MHVTHGRQVINHETLEHSILLFMQHKQNLIPTKKTRSEYILWWTITFDYVSLVWLSILCIQCSSRWPTGIATIDFQTWGSVEELSWANRQADQVANEYRSMFGTRWHWWGPPANWCGSVDWGSNCSFCVYSTRVGFLSAAPCARWAHADPSTTTEFLWGKAYEH